MNLLWLRGRLGERVDGASLALFRIAFGAVMILDAHLRYEKHDTLFSPDYVHMKYAWFTWVEPLPANWMVASEVVVLGLCAALVALGFAFRVAAPLYTLIYTHLFLVEKLYYNNHYYLTILLMLLLCFTQADRCYSVRSWLEARRGDSEPKVDIPLWNYALLRAQIFVLYFFGGVAKLDSDWLQGEPVLHWLEGKTVAFPASLLVGNEWGGWLVVFAGVVLDLSAGFLLLGRKTFWLAAALLVMFHTTNSQLFSIGIFPYMGVASVLLFLQPHWGRRAWVWSFAKGNMVLTRAVLPTPKGSALASPVTVWLICGYLLVQVLFPLRHFAYGNNASWTDVGHQFAWRMMMRSNSSRAEFVFDPPEAEQRLEEAGRMPEVAPGYMKRLSKSPFFLLQYAHELDRNLEALGMPDVEIRVLAVGSLNGRPYQPLIDPTRDLTEARYAGFGVPDWIVPLDPDARPGQYPADRAERERRIALAMERVREVAPGGSPLVVPRLGGAARAGE